MQRSVSSPDLGRASSMQAAPILGEALVQEDNIETLLGKLLIHRKHARDNHLKVWGLTELINSFNTSASYNLDETEYATLFEDMKAVVTMLDAAQAFANDKEKTNPQLEINFENSLNLVVTRAEANMTSKRDIAIWVGIGMAGVAMGTAIGMGIALTVGITIAFAPIIIAALVVGALALLVASAVAHVHQNRCTFFGQSVNSHSLMADLVLEKGELLEPEAIKKGCFG